MAIDGPGGTGKSTLAGQLAKDLGAQIIPMDHFLLPEASYRLSAIAKNYDLERFVQDVIDPIVLGEPIRYEVLDSKTGKPRIIRVPREKPVIIEGIYSLEIRAREAYDFSFFVNADRETLLRRAVSTAGEFGSWLSKWLVGEETYLDAQSPKLAATLILDGSVPFPSTAQLMEMVELRVNQESI
jgi:uridine kinase